MRTIAGSTRPYRRLHPATPGSGRSGAGPSRVSLAALLLGISVLGAVRALAVEESFEEAQATLSAGATWQTGGRTGEHCVRIERASEQEAPLVTLPVTAALPGRYVLSGWLRGRVTRGADRNFSVELNAVWLDAEGHVAGRARGPFASGALPVWEYREAVVSAPAGTASVRLEFGFTGAVVGFCDLDDVCLTQGEAGGDLGQKIPAVECRPGGAIMAPNEPCLVRVTLPASLGPKRRVQCQVVLRDSLGARVGGGAAAGEIPDTWRAVIDVPLSLSDPGSLSGEWLEAQVAVRDAVSSEDVGQGRCGVLLLPRPTDFERKPDSPFALLVGHPYTKRWLGARWDRPNLCNERLLELARRYGVSRMPLLDVPFERIDEPGVAEGFRQQVTEYVRANALYLDYLQVGNEPPLFRPGVTERYVKCLRIAYEAAKAEKPSIRVAAAGITGLDIDEEMVARMLAAGAAQYCDMIDIHTYLSLPEMDRIVGKVRTQMAAQNVRLPLILTEVTAHLGSPITERAKASHIYQRYAIALGHGIAQIYWFVLHWVNADPGGFGYCGLIDVATNAPWPAAAAYARLTAVLEDRPFAARLGTAVPGAWVYAFEGAAGHAVIAWSDTPGVFVELAGADRIALFDVFGRVLRHSGDTRCRLELTREPLLIEAGAAVAAVVRADGTGARVLARGSQETLVVNGFSSPPEARLVHGLTVLDGAAPQPTVRASPDAPLGETEAWFTGPRVEGGWGLRRAGLTVTDPLELRLQPIIRSGMPAFRAEVQNRSANSISGEVTVVNPFGGAARPDLLRAPFTDLAGGTSRELLLPVGGVCDPRYLPRVHAWATTSGGARAEWSRWVGFMAAARRTTPAEIDAESRDWPAARPIQIGPWARARQDALGSDPETPGDLAGAGAVTWDAAALYVLVEVTDDTHRNERQDGALWDGDSIQLGIAREPGCEGVESCEVSVGLGVAGPQGWIHRNVAGCPTGPAHFPLQVRRHGTCTVYELAIPWKTIGIDQVGAGTWLGFGLVINEDDSGQRGWLGWHEGIAAEKNPALFGQLELAEED